MHKGDGQQKKRLDGAGAESKAGGEAFYIPYVRGRARKEEKLSKIFLTYC